MDIKKREKIAMGSYSVANVCLRGIKIGSQIIALIYVIGFGASLIGLSLIHISEPTRRS